MKYLPYIALTLIAAAAGLFIWSKKSGRNSLGPSSQVTPQNTGDLLPPSPPGVPGGNNSFISPNGNCPLGYRTSYQTVNCIMAPCPAQTICTKDALLSAMGGFAGNFLGHHNFPLN